MMKKNGTFKKFMIGKTASWYYDKLYLLVFPVYHCLRLYSFISVLLLLFYVANNRRADCWFPSTTTSYCTVLCVSSASWMMTSKLILKTKTTQYNWYSIIICSSKYNTANNGWEEEKGFSHITWILNLIYYVFMVPSKYIM